MGKNQHRLTLFLIIISLLLQTIGVPEVLASTATVTTTNNANMIRHPSQRKTFYDRGRYWVFYQNNTAPIKIYYTSSLDGTTWETPTLLTSSSSDVNFAVWLDESTHDVSYVANFGTLKYRKGTLQPDGTIVWYDSEQTIYSPWISDWWYLRDTNTSIAGKNIFDAVNGTYGSANYTTEVVVGTASIGDLFYIDPYHNTTSSFGTTEPASITNKGWRTPQFSKTYSHGGWTPYIRLQVRYTNTFKGKIGIRIWNDTNADLSTATVLNDWTWLAEKTYTTLGEEIISNQEIYLPDITMTNEYMYFEFIFNITQAGTNVDAGFFLRANDVYSRVRANAMTLWGTLSFFNIVEDSSGYPHIIAVNVNGFNNTVQIAKASLNNGSWGTTTWTELLESDDSSDNYNTALVQLGSNKLMAMYQTGYSPIQTRFYNGATWASEVNVTNTVNDYPWYKEQWTVSSDGTNIHLVYNNMTTVPNRLLRYSNWTEGSGWLTPEPLGVDAQGDKSPSVTLSQNGTLYVFWTSTTTIYYTRRSPSGTWDSTATTLETDSTIQHLLGVQTSFSDYSNRITVAWTRLSAGNYDVRFSSLAIAPYTFTFHGPYDETTGKLIWENITYESYTLQRDTALSIYGAFVEAQTFTPSESHDINIVRLKLYKVGSPGDVELSIRYVVASMPFGSDLANATINGDLLTETTSGEWYYYHLNQSVALNGGITYSIVVNASGGDLFNRVVWLAMTGDPYARGNRAYYDAGWHTDTSRDCLFEEVSGETAVTVTAYFTDGTDPEQFVVRKTYVFAGRPETHKPQYFKFGTSKEREYWLSDDETTGDIYIFDDSLTDYNIVFLDLVGALDDYPYVYAQHYINGTLRTVEKRKVDVEKKIHMCLVNGRKYNLIIIDGSSYTFGDLLMTDTTTIQLTLRGLSFPKETLLTYKYVRIYWTRALGNPNGNITVTYQDTLAQTTSVALSFDYRNGTNAYNATETADSFVHTWSSTLNNTDYQGTATITHARYGTWSVKQYFPRSFSEAPWGLGFLGTLPFATSVIIPSLLIMFVAGCFSQINAQVGAFMATVTAAALTYLGWIAIPAGYLITAFCIAVFMALIFAKRRIET